MMARHSTIRATGVVSIFGAAGPALDEVGLSAWIAQAAPGCDLSRVGADLIVVGQFDNKAVADQAVAAIRAADPQLSVKVTEIAK